MWRGEATIYRSQRRATDFSAWEWESVWLLNAYSGNAEINLGNSELKLTCQNGACLTINGGRCQGTESNFPGGCNDVVNVPSLLPSLWTEDTACCVGNGDNAAEGGHPDCAQCGCGAQALQQALPPARCFHERSTPSTDQGFAAMKSLWIVSHFPLQVESWIEARTTWIVDVQANELWAGETMHRLHRSYIGFTTTATWHTGISMCLAVVT